MLEKREWLQVITTLGIILFVVVSLITSDFASYLLQLIFLIYIAVFSGKRNPSPVSRKIIIICSVLILLVRLITYTSPWDLIDIGLWGSIIYLVAF